MESVVIATRQCERCGLTLVRRRYPGGQLEHTGNFARRRTCGLTCPPPKMSFAAEYMASIARGIDPFELNDAHWED
jgi:hypothetical protein